MRYSTVTPDNALQALPGREEIASGEPAGDEHGMEALSWKERGTVPVLERMNTEWSRCPEGKKDAPGKTWAERRTL
jgi:hypothetical protein